MKKFLSLCLCLLLLVGMLPTAHAADGLSVTINGEAVTFDQPPVLQNGRTLVPIRAVCEALGADVYWYEDAETVFIVKNGIKLMIAPNEPYIGEILVENFDELLPLLSEDITFEDEHPKAHGIPLDVPAQIINGRTLLPIRAVCEALGATVDWDDATQTVRITCPQEIIDDKNKDKDFFDRFVAFIEEQQEIYYTFLREPFLDNDYTVTMKVRGSFANDEAKTNYALLLENFLLSCGFARTEFECMTMPKQITFFFGVDGNFDQEALVAALLTSPSLQFKDADGNILLDETDIAGAEVTYNKINGEYKPNVSVTFTEAGRVKVAQATERIAALFPNGENYIGIYFNGVCISKPYVMEKIDDTQCVIGGNLTDETAYLLAIALHPETFPDDVSFEFEIQENK